MSQHSRALEKVLTCYDLLKKIFKGIFEIFKIIILVGIKNVKNIDIETKDFYWLYNYIKYLEQFDLNENTDIRIDDNVTENAVMKKLEQVM